MASDVPVMISKQSGVGEVITHVLKVDFWDVSEMANKMIAVLRHPPLHSALRNNGATEVRKFHWADAARACCQLYEDLQTSGSTQARN
jgi:glycosyltransferase involved in cell wall biosynthesis